MDKWSGTAGVTYRRWRDSKEGGDSDFGGQADEDQGTDNEICTIATPTAHAGGVQAASNSESNHNKATFTVDQALEAVGFGVFHVKLSLVAGLSWIADAMEMMILGVLGPQLHCEWRLPSYQVALISSVVFIGMGFGAPAWGNFSDKFGRKTGLTFSMWWTLYFGFLSAFSPVYGWFFVLRGLVGFGIGGTPLSVTLYSEFLPVKARGICVMLIACFWAIGSLLEVLLAYLVMPTLGWRWLLGLSTIPLVIFICFCTWLPESPRFDLLTGRTDKAIKTLTRIAKENGKTLPLGRIVSCVQNNRGQIKDLFSPQYCKTTVLLWFIWFANGFCYYGIVLLTTELFQDGDVCGTTQGAKIEPNCSLECNFLTKDDYKDLLWTTVAEFPGLLVILGAIEHIGRKKSLALGFFMFSLSILPLYACIGRKALTVFIFIARAFISGGFQAVFVYTSEVFPTDSRALAMGTCSAFSRLGALITPFVAQVMLRTSVYLTLALYCGCSLLAGVASLLLPIETLGRRLLESTSIIQSE